MCKENILNKIKNLLNKTVENGCTEAEAMSAIVTARKLMLKHKVEEKDLVNKSEKDIVKVCLDKYNVSIPWLYLLIDVFTSNFGIMKCIRKVGKIQHFILFGFKDDVDCVIELIKCAYEVAEEKADKYAREYRELFGTAKGVKYAWFEGFVAGIRVNYEEQNKNGEFALMIKVDKSVENEFNNITKDYELHERVIKTNKDNQEAKYSGYVEGKKFGKTPLSEGM